jgi:hypothetical protein
MRRLCVAILVLSTSCKPAPPPEEIIAEAYSLRQVLDESDLVAEGTIESTDADGRYSVLRRGTIHKGTCPTSSFRLNVTSGFLKGEPEQVLRHLVPGAPVVVFTRGSVMLLYVNRFFLLSHGGWNTDAGAVWDVRNLDAAANRTWNGPASELGPLIPRILDGRAKGPPLDPKMPAITLEALQALPLPGQPADEEYLPAPFRPRRPPPSEPRRPETPGDVVAGLRYELFEAGPTENLDRLQPLGTGEAALPELPDVPREAPAALRYRGFIDVPKDGEYFFHLISRSQVTLFLGGTPLVINEGGSAVLERAADVALLAGRHAIVLTVYEGSGDPPPRLLWSGPGFARQAVPADRLSRPR